MEVKAEIGQPSTKTPEEIAAHEAAMIAKADGQAAPAPKADEGLILGKFKSAEDLAKAYSELEKKLGEKKPEPAAAATPEAPAKIEPNADADAQAAKAVEAAGLDLNAVTAEFTEKGELSAETYEKLEKAGYKKDLVDGYLAGQKALAEQFTNSVYERAGGQSGYMEMINWARGNLNAAEIKAFNDALDSGSKEKVFLAIDGLKARFGAEPKLLGGTATNTADVFQSSAQVTEAMRDPRYAKDPAYRAQVEAKLARSNIF